MEEEKQLSILDEIFKYCGRFVIYPNEQARIAHTLWIAGSYFLENPDIKVFDNYPMLAFLSPDEDSGKTRALDVTQALAYNSLDGGSYTAASLCHEIDSRWPTMTTLILDELDETLGPNQENAPFVRLLNNGYQRGKVIVRRHLMEQRNITTQAYCPKAIGGLTVTKLKRTTRSRMIIVRMRPLKKGETVQRHIDKEEGHRLSEVLKTWRPTIYERLKAIDEDSLSNLSNRAAQIWHPLLALAKIAGGEDWFRRASDTAQHFTSKQKPEDSLAKKLLIELYKVYLSNKHPKGIHGDTFAGLLSSELAGVTQSTVSYCLGANGYAIPTTQIKIGGVNRNGWVWEDCLPFFEDHLTEDERGRDLARTSPLPASTTSTFDADGEVEPVEIGSATEKKETKILANELRDDEYFLVYGVSKEEYRQAMEEYDNLDHSEAPALVKFLVTKGIKFNADYIRNRSAA